MNKFLFLLITSISTLAINAQTTAILKGKVVDSVGKQILKDEDAHIDFQCYALCRLGENKKYLGLCDTERAKARLPMPVADFNQLCSYFETNL